MIVILLCLLFTAHKVCLSVTYRTYRNGYWWLRDYSRQRTNSNHESQVEIIYKLTRNKISLFSIYLSYAWECEIQTGDLSHFFMEVDPADWNFFRAIFCSLAIKGRGSQFSACSFIKMLFCCRDILHHVCKQHDHVIMLSKNQSAHSPGSHLHSINLNICK